MEPFRYRPELDGLRAVAVLAVLLFHADLGLPGGFVGVDVFFVLSGYLITSLIVRDLEAGSFTFAEFWERRARRILPASTLLVATTLVAGSVLLMPKDFSLLGISALATAAFGANVFFWRNVDYFTTAADELPLLHMWSLSVEEQFYFIVPWLFWLASRSWNWSRTTFFYAIATACFASFGLATWAVPRMPAAAFYLLPPRAWELGLGSLVALWPPHITPVDHLSRAACAWLGLSGICLACVLFDGSTSFPGVAALPPCLGTALFILSTARRIDSPLPLPARMLSSRPCVAVGLVSYSLYLWHWPLFAFMRYWSLEPLSITTRIALCGISLITAFFSWRFIETPFRVRSATPNRWALLAATVLALSALATTGFIIRAGDGFPQRFSPAMLELARDDLRTVAAPSAALTQLRTGTLPVLGDSADPLTLLVWGDSHAMAILPAIEQLCREKRVAAYYAVHSSTAPVVGYEHSDKYSRGKDAPAFAEALVDFVASKRIPNVLLAARWSGYFAESRTYTGSQDRNAELLQADFGRALRITVQRLVLAGAKPWLFAEVPNHKVDVPKALRAQLMFGVDTNHFCADRASHDSLLAPLTLITPDLEKLGAVMIDASGELLTPSTQRYCMAADGVPLYLDQHHLSRAGALMIMRALAPCLDGNVRPAPENPRFNAGQGSHETGIAEDEKR